jgi:4-hydroxybenzoate polyprenyltransferase
VKNLLLFVPLLTSFGFLDPVNVAKAIGAFLIFSIAASATYVLNDSFDLESDRLHPRKRHRPFASGRIPLLHGIVVALSLLTIAFTVAPILSLHFAALLLVYVCLTIAYSLTLKQYVLIDVLTLGLLYTLRIMAGSAAVGVSVSPWLLAFSVFLFISLALVKRCSELVSLGREGRMSASGRDYEVTDLAVLWPLGVGTALSAVVVFGLFINAPETQEHYATPALLWAAALGLVYWLGRLWIKTVRGEMHDDPILFAVGDRGRIVIAGIVLVTLAAHWVVIRGLT